MIQDHARIRALCRQLFPAYKTTPDIQRLAGMTNHNYKVTLGEHCYAFRLPGAGTSDLINRADEELANRLADELGVDAGLLFFDPQSGEKICRFIPEAETLSPERMRSRDNLKLVADTFRRMHNCEKNTGIRFDLFRQIENYEGLLAACNDCFVSADSALQADLTVLKADYARLNISEVFCHNDPLCENWLRKDDKIYLIDWEYAGMNDPLWDLADVAIEANLSLEEEAFLLENYLGKAITPVQTRQYLMNKVFIDYLWSMWGQIRSYYDESLKSYGAERLRRAKKSLEEYKRQGR